MKKIICILLALLLGISAATPAFCVQAVSADTGLTVSAANNAYTAFDPGVVDFPYTFETTISFPADYDPTSRGGVILGSYVDSSISSFNFEIYKNGAPRVYVQSTEFDESGKPLSFDVIFDQVSVYTGAPVHIAITADPTPNANVWNCYIDGELAQTVSAAVPEPFYLTKAFAIGGDTRVGNGQYFKGTIHNIALYADARTHQEILLDKDSTAESIDTANLTHYYDFSDIAAGQLPATIASPLNLGPVFYHGAPGENPIWWIRDKAPVTDYAYSFAIVGDPQILNLHYPEKMTAMYKWIADNKEEKNIQYCLTLGDLTDDNTTNEYNRIKSCFGLLDNAGLPYGFVRGNHDKAGNFDTHMTYDKFGDKTPEGGSFDGTMKNTWNKLTVGRVKYMFINVDYQEKSDMLEQINDFIAANKDYNVIVSTHVYLNSRAQYTSSLRWEQTDKDELSGIDFWEQMIRKHDNIVLTLCGHSPSSKILTRNEKNLNGYNIPQVLIDCQDEDLAMGGLGMVAMFYFSEDGSRVQVEHYSVDRDAYFREESQFEMKLNVVNADASVTPAVPVTPNAKKVYNLRRSGEITSAANAVSTLATEYEAGYRDWMIASHYANFNRIQLLDYRIYAGYNAYDSANPANSKWIAFKLRSPGVGTYQVTINSDVVGATDPRTGVPLNAYLFPANLINSDATADDYAALMTDANKLGYYAYGTGNASGNFGAYTFGEGDYILIVQGAAKPNNSLHANNFYLKSIELTADGIMVGQTPYNTFDEALANAKNGDTITLLSDASATNVELPDGVTLNLGGNTLTVEEFGILPGSAAKITDTSADSAGLLRVAAASASFQGETPFAANTLPLYDSELGGYRFFTYTYEKRNTRVTEDKAYDDAAKFWYQFQFVNKEAYALISSGNSGIKLGAILKYGENSAKEYLYKTENSADLWAQSWGAFAYTANNPWLWVRVVNVSTAENVSITPTVTAGGVDIVLGTIKRNPNDIGDVDFGWDQAGPIR